MDTALHLACIGSLYDDERSIGELLLAGADTNFCNSEGCKPRDLMLLTVGEEAEYRSNLLSLLDRPMLKAARDDAAKTVGSSAAVIALDTDDAHRSSPDVMSNFIECISRLDTQRFKVLLGSHGLHHSRQADGATLLHLCAQSGFHQGVCLLLQSKCPMRLDLHGCTALHHAAAANHPLIASELLCAFPSSLAMCNDAGDTAFITSVRAHAPAVIAVLTAVPQGSSSRAAALTKALTIPGAEGLPPLHLSVKIGALRCAELLLSAQPSHANLHTPTIPHPLHVLAASRSEVAEGAARLLLQAGADVNAKDSNGISAAGIAAAAGNASLSRILAGVASAVAELESLKVSAL
jgi:ankyrin repeat protein